MCCKTYFLMYSIKTALLISQSPLKSLLQVSHELFNSPESMCMECVRERCRVIRMKARLTEDHKVIAALLKQKDGSLTGWVSHFVFSNIIIRLSNSLKVWNLQWTFGPILLQGNLDLGFYVGLGMQFMGRPVEFHQDSFPCQHQC